MKQQCTATNQNGQRCGAPCMKRRRFCVFHNPSKSAERIRHKGRSVGGKRTRAKVIATEEASFEISSPSDAARLLSRLVSKVLRGQLETRVGSAVAYMLSQAVIAMQRDAAAAATKVEFLITPPSASVPDDPNLTELERIRRRDPIPESPAATPGNPSPGPGKKPSAPYVVPISRA